MDSGATFCHVRRIRPVCSGIPCVTSGSQKWNGASPSFIDSEISVILISMLFVCCWKAHTPSWL